MNRTDRVREILDQGRVTFMGLELRVGAGALVPREETELLARAVIDALRVRRDEALRVVDMCCGVGNVACAIAHFLPRAHVWAADLTPTCVALALHNAESLGLSERVSVHQGDLFGALESEALAGTIDLVVCNPPYISDSRLVGELAGLLEHEPREAFAAGPYGVGLHLRVAREALAYLKPGALLFMEVGAGQDRQVRTVLDRTRGYQEIGIVSDPGGLGRVIYGRRSGA